jgi:hypothetical protein
MSYDPSHRKPPRQERWPNATPPEGWPSYRDGDAYREGGQADSRYGADRRGAYPATAGYRSQVGYQRASGEPGDRGYRSAVATDTFPPARNGYGSAGGYRVADGHSVADGYGVAGGNGVADDYGVADGNGLAGDYGPRRDDFDWGTVGSGGSRHGYRDPGNGYVDPGNGYVDPGNGYAGGINGYTGAADDFAETTSGYGSSRNGYTGTIDGYPAAAEDFPDATYGFDGTTNGYHRAEGGYGRAEGGYGRAEGGYGRAEADYGRAEGGYGRAEADFSRAEGGYGRAETGYGRATDEYLGDTNGYDWNEHDYGRLADGFADPADDYGRPADGFADPADDFAGYPGQGSYAEPASADPRLTAPDVGVRPGSWQADQDRRREASQRGPLVGAVTVFLAAAVAVGVSTLAAAFVRPQASPITVVGGVFIDRTPAALKNFAVEHFGSHERALLLLGMYAMLALVALGIGVLARRETAFGVAAIAAFSLFGAFVAITRGDGRVTDVAPSVIGGLAGVAALMWLVRASAPPPRVGGVVGVVGVVGVAPIRSARGGSRRRTR